MGGKDDQIRLKSIEKIRKKYILYLSSDKTYHVLALL